MAHLIGQREMTQEEHDNGLQALAEQVGGKEILSIPGVWEIVSEFYNNEVISHWEEEQFTNDQEEEDSNEAEA